MTHILRTIYTTVRRWLGFGEVAISARVYRAATGQWEDHGIIARGLVRGIAKSKG